MARAFKPHLCLTPSSLAGAQSRRPILLLAPRALPPKAEARGSGSPLALPLPGSDGAGRQTDQPLGARGAAACRSRSQHALQWKSRKVSATKMGFCYSTQDVWLLPPHHPQHPLQGPRRTPPPSMPVPWPSLRVSGWLTMPPCEGSLTPLLIFRAPLHHAVLLLHVVTSCCFPSSPPLSAWAA